MKVIPLLGEMSAELQISTPTLVFQIIIIININGNFNFICSFAVYAQHTGGSIGKVGHSRCLGDFIKQHHNKAVYGCNIIFNTVYFEIFKEIFK